MPCTRRFVAFDAAELSGNSLSTLSFAERVQKFCAEPAPHLWPLQVEYKEFLRNRLPREANDADGIMVHGVKQDYKWKEIHTVDLRCDAKGKLRAHNDNHVWGTAFGRAQQGVWECTAEQPPRLLRKRFDKPRANPAAICREIMRAQEQGIRREELLQAAR